MSDLLDTLKSVFSGPSPEQEDELLKQARAVQNQPAYTGSPFLVGPGASAAEALLAVLASQTKGPEGAMLAMIPTKKNLPTFLGAMKSLMGDSESLGSHAQAYTAVRYPRRYAVPRGYKVLAKPPAPNVMGETQNRVVSYLDPDKHGISARETIDTINHEIQHAVDFKRALRSLEFGNDKPANEIFADQSRPYQDRWMEKRAFQAGGTAAAGYDKFLQLLKDVFGH